jgi:hypothetical protein
MQPHRIVPLFALAVLVALVCGVPGCSGALHVRAAVALHVAAAVRAQPRAALCVALSNAGALDHSQQSHEWLIGWQGESYRPTPTVVAEGTDAQQAVRQPSAPGMLDGLSQATAMLAQGNHQGPGAVLNVRTVAAAAAAPPPAADTMRLLDASAGNWPRSGQRRLVGACGALDDG